MKKIIFTKCSVERRRQYQIITRILEEDGKRFVQKIAANKEAEAHILRLYEISKREERYNNPQIHLAECKMLDEKTLEFEYIEGERLDDRAKNHIREHEWDLFFEDIELLKNIVCDVKDTQAFYGTEEFTEIFGQADFSQEYIAASGMNIDLVMSNIILDNRINIIDYEWTMDMPVPLKYILYRSILLSGILNMLSEEKKAKVMEMIEVSPEEQEKFFDMEKHFQNYITGTSLQELYNQMPIKCYPVFEEDLEKNLMNSIVYGTGEGENAGEEHVYLDSDVCLEINCAGGEDECLIWKPLQTNGIIKIRQIKDKDTGETLPFQTNAELVVIDDYYFSNPPEIRIERKECKTLLLEWKVWEHNNAFISRIVVGMKEEQRAQELAYKSEQLEMRAKELEMRAKELEHRYRLLEKLYRMVKRIKRG